MREKLFPSQETIDAKTIEYKAYQLKYYTPLEEILNFISHFAGLVFILAGLAFLVEKATSPYKIAAVVLFTFGFCMVFGMSSLYHALTNLKWKSFIRKIDHSSISFIVISCGVAICFTTPTFELNISALCLCYALTIVNFVICIVNLEKYKNYALVNMFLVGIILFVVAIVNRNYLVERAIIFYVLGLAFCLLGSILYGIKKRYMHAVFHVFTLIGPILFYVATMIQLS